jgi:hypothetical protein|tara:strand:- start:173 stop:856 length:684 start_codon:yes stop_codon:yes gene_type:complete
MAYTLTNLQDDIKSYTEVDSTVFTEAVLNRFIQNAEERIFRSFDADMERHYATSTTIIGNRYVTIPSDLRVIRYVQLKDSSGNQVYLEQRDPSYIATYYDTPGTASSTLPKYYANWDENYWVIAPTPNAAYEITLAYNKNPVSLTDATKSTTGTYLSNKYQDLILYASLVNAYAYLKGPQDMLQYYGAAYKEALETYATEQIGRRRRNEYQDGVIRLPIKSESPSSY